MACQEKNWDIGLNKNTIKRIKNLNEIWKGQVGFRQTYVDI